MYSLQAIRPMAVGPSYVATMLICFSAALDRETRPTAIYMARMPKNTSQRGSVARDKNFEDMTFLIGPNGAGRTAVLQALARLFASPRPYVVRAGTISTFLNPQRASVLLRSICGSKFNLNSPNSRMGRGYT